MAKICRNTKMDKLGCVLRIDNVLKPSTFENFKKIMDIINNYPIDNVKVVIDVTPKWHGQKSTETDYINFIKSQLDRGHVLALHGVEHRCRILQEHEHKVSWLPSEDEFDCKDYHLKHKKDIPVEIQEKWLIEGNKLLKGYFNTTTDLLMPPAHAFNINTLTAMQRQGFKIISTYGRWDASPYIKQNILMLPFDFEDYMKNTNEDGSNKKAMLDMFKRYYNNCAKQKGYFAFFIHCDFSGEGNATEARLGILKEMIEHILKDNNKFIDPHEFLKLFSN